MTSVAWPPLVVGMFPALFFAFLRFLPFLAPSALCGDAVLVGGGGE